MILSGSIRRQGETSEYPAVSILLAMALIVLSPFVSAYLCYVAFALCIYRMVRYDEKVFAVDYCMLVPVTQIFRMTGGMTFLIWLCLIASIWYFIRGRVQGDGALVCLLLLLNYLLLRMQLDINNFVLCFGQMFFLYVVLPKQDMQSAERAAKVFCWSLVITSLYGLLVRDTYQLVAIRGEESPAIWGTGIMRFYGLFRDPNFYMTLLVVGLTLLCKLKDCGRIHTAVFVVLGVAMIAFGVLTYSKTFFLVLILLVGIYIVWQFWNRKVLRGLFMILVAVIAAGYLIFAEGSPFAVVLSRLTAAENLSDLTTGRTDVYAQYLDAIFKNSGTFLFGYGLAADSLFKDPHNIYIELAYYTGTVGLALYGAFSIIMFRKMHSKLGESRQNVIAKYVLVIMMLVLYFPLNGIFVTIFYSELFITLMAVMLIKPEAKMVEAAQ
jgi:O-antigen ligase